MKFKHPGQWYSPAWLLSGNVDLKDINAEYRYLRVKVKQCLDRLIKSTNGRYADTQWVREAQEILQIGGRGPRAKALSLAAFHDWLGRIYRIGDDWHDQLTISEDGRLQYYNLQNGDGCVSGYDGDGFGYEFVPNEDEYGYSMDPREVEDR